MKKLSNFLIILSLLAVSLAAHAQEDLSYLPPGLHKLTPEELTQMPLVVSKLPHFKDGKPVKKTDILSLLIDPNYSKDFYGDKNGKPKAVVIREATAAEKSAKEEVGPARGMGPTYWDDKPAPTFIVDTMDGREVNLTSLKGKVVVLNFWFIGCKPCVMEMPELNELTKAFEGQEVEFLAFALDKEDRIKQFLKEKEFIYQIVPEARSTAKEYKVSGYPTHMIIDQQGTVAFFQRGYKQGTGDILEREIAKLLK